MARVSSVVLCLRAGRRWNREISVLFKMIFLVTSYRYMSWDLQKEEETMSKMLFMLRKH